MSAIYDIRLTGNSSVYYHNDCPICTIISIYQESDKFSMRSLGILLCDQRLNIIYCFLSLHAVLINVIYQFKQ